MNDRKMQDSKAEPVLRIVDADHPWLGLSPFTSATKEYFFGRDQEIRDLFLRVREQPLTILYGQSGLGKTSLLGAGLVPKLQVEGFVPYVIRLSYEPNDPSLVDQTLADLHSLRKSESAQTDRNEPKTLWEFSHYLPGLPEELASQPPVLIFDQFEEIFTLGESNARQRQAHEFFTQLADLVENRPPAEVQQRLLQNRRLSLQYDLGASSARVVLALREDYLSHLEDWKKTMPSLMRNRVGIYQLNGPQALEAVVRAGRREGRNLVSDEVGTNIVRFAAKRKADTPLSEIAAVPPILSLLCDELNEARLANHQSQITAELVAAQSADILQNFYNRAFDGLPPQVRRLVEDRMVTVSGHRNPVAREDMLSELSSQGVANPQAALDQLILGRLLSSEERGGIQRVEITHDVLAPLVVHSRDDRRAREQIEQAERQREAAAAQRRRFQRIAAVMIALTTIAIVGSVVAIAASLKAREQELVATKQTKIANEKTKEAEKLLDQQVEQTLAASKLVFDFGITEYEGGRLRSGTDKIHQAWSVRKNDDPLKTSYGRVLIDRLTRGGRSHVILPYSNIIADIAISPDGTRVATAATDSIIQIWDTTTGASVGEAISVGETICSIVFSSDGTLIAIGTDEGVQLWDVRESVRVRKPLNSDLQTKVVVFSPDGSRLAALSWLGSVPVWDVSSGKALFEPLEHNISVNSIAFSADGTRLATGSYDNTAKLWNAATGALIGTVQHQGPVLSLAFSPNQKMLATASGDDTAHLWDAASGAPLGNAMIHGGDVYDVAFNPNGTCLATASADGTARLWDILSQTQIGPMMQHGEGVIAVAFSPDGSRVATASYDGSARVWDAANGDPFTEPLRHDHRVDQILFSADGTRVVTASWDHTIRIWDPLIGTPLGYLIEHARVNQLMFTADSARLITLCDTAIANDATAKKLGTDAKLWDLSDVEAIEIRSYPRAIAVSPDGTRYVSMDEETVQLRKDSGDPIGQPIKHTFDDVTDQILFSPDGSRFAIASGSKLHVWDASTASPAGEPIEHYGRVREFVFSPDGSRIATASQDDIVNIWNAKNGELICKCIGHAETVNAVEFSLDGTRVVTGSHDKTARIWDATTGNMLGKPMEHEDWVISVAFHPNGSSIGTGTANTTAHIWNATTCQRIGEGIKHEITSSVWFVEFSPDGKYFVTSAMDTIKISDAATAASLYVVLPSGEEIESLAFSPDGKSLAAGSFGKTVSIWDFPSYPTDLNKYIEVLSDIEAGKPDHDSTFDGWLEEHLKAATFKNRHSIAMQSYAKQDWFAAAFHLQWLCDQQPANHRWREMLGKAERHLEDKDAETPVTTQ